MKGSLIIVAFFILGTFCGIYDLIPFDIANSRISFYALCALMFCVGISVGNDPQTLKNFRMLNPRLVFLPVMTILGTLAGSAVISLLLPHRSVTDCLAVGSGFGYYSLSSIFITEYKGAELGTIALLANISREILTLLAAPYWYDGLATSLLSRRAAQRQWIPHYLSLPGLPDNNLSWYPFFTVSWWISACLFWSRCSVRCK